MTIPSWKAPPASGRVAVTALCAGLLLGSSAYGQNTANKQAAKPGTGIRAKQPVPNVLSARARPAQRPTMGPPQPGKVQQIKPTRPSKAVPLPTVVLKPGELPALVFDTPTYNFGRLRAGQDVIHDFWFTNTGTGPLEVLQVKPG